MLIAVIELGFSLRKIKIKKICKYRKKIKVIQKGVVISRIYSEIYF